MTIALDARIAAQVAGKRAGGLRLQLAGDQPVPRAQEGPRDRRRAGIGRELVARVERADHIEIRRQQRRHGPGERRGHQPRNAVAPFAAALRFRTGEVVEPGAGMGVDDAEGRRFLAQIMQDAREHRVLVHIGEAAGMKGVAVVQGDCLQPGPRRTASRTALARRAADLTFRPPAQCAPWRNVESKAARKSNMGWYPFSSDLRMKACSNGIRTSEPGH